MSRRRRARSIDGMTDSLAIVLAGGGERIVAWHVGVLAGLAAAGREPRRAAAVIGTSAGALVAARLAAGIDPRTDALAVTPRAPAADVRATFERLTQLWGAPGGSDDDRRRRIGAVALNHTGDPELLVAAIRQRLPRTAFPPSLQIAAIDAERGERIAFGASSGVPLERAVAASRAIPGLHPPVPIHGRRFIDGAVGSATNADLALAVPARTIIVVTGIGDRPEPRTPESLWAAALEREVAELEAAGRRVIVVRPGAADRAAMGDDPMSGAGARATVAAGRRAGKRLYEGTRAAA
jgi:NTE family protein